MPEEVVIRGEDAEGMAAVIRAVGLVVQTVGCEEDVYAVTSGAVVFLVEVYDLARHEDEG